MINTKYYYCGYVNFQCSFFLSSILKRLYIVVWYQSQNIITVDMPVALFFSVKNSHVWKLKKIVNIVVWCGIVLPNELSQQCLIFVHCFSLPTHIQKSKKIVYCCLVYYCHLSCCNVGYSYKRMSWLLGLSVCLVCSFSLFLLVSLLLLSLSFLFLNYKYQRGLLQCWIFVVDCCISLQVVITNRWTTDRSHFCILLFGIDSAGFCMHRYVKLSRFCIHSYIE